MDREPNRADIWAAYARSLLTIGRPEQAMACLDRAMALPSTDALTADTLGNCLTRLGRHQDAIGCFEDAVSRSPDRADYQWNLATALTFHGELDRAEAGFRRVLELDPDHVGAWLGLADLLDGEPPAGRIEAIEAVRERAATHVDRHLVITHALAKTLDAAGQTEPAFNALLEAKSRKKAETGYTIAEDSEVFAAVTELFPGSGELSPVASGQGPRPIFIVGMPRTGTTLLERMLSMHSAITAAGELTALPECIRAAGQGRPGRLFEAAVLRRAAAGDMSSIGGAYRDLVPVAVAGSDWFIDKQPLNFLLIGFILQALPDARIICLRRGALATCLANFRQLFAADFPHYRYGLDPADTADYFGLFDGLMRHWDNAYPGAVHQLAYEDLVAEPETTLRAVLGHLELEYEDAVLASQDNAAPVATASSVQVRKPVHTESVAAWQRYADQLEPVRKRLESLGIGPEAIGRRADA